MSAKVITISNIKGGVAKTTSAATLAAGLNYKGKKVLMIDSDPQMNLTMCFMKEPKEGTPSLYMIYKKENTIKDVIINIREGLDIVPGDFELCSADMDFFGQVGALRQLDKALRSVRNEYDYIIIDTPPNLGYLSLNAFMTTTYILTPMSAESFSLRAIRLLKRTIDMVSEEVDKKIDVIGVLLTRYNGRTNLSKLLETNINEAANLLETKLFKSRIRSAIAVQESQMVKQDLFSYAPKASVTQDYEKFVNEFLERAEK